MNFRIAKPQITIVFMLLLGILGMQWKSASLTLVATAAAVFLVTFLIFNFSISLASAVVIPFTIVGITETFNRAINVPLILAVQSSLISAILLCGLLSVFIGYSPRTFRYRSSSLFIFIALLAPSIMSIAILLINGNIFGSNLLWVVQGDAQTNTVSANEIIEKNGFTDAIPSLTQGVMALAIAENISGNISPVSFITMMQTQAGILFLFWAITSVLFGAIAWKEFKTKSSTFQFVVVFVSASIPLTWGVLGFSIEAGFFNTPFALISILASWIFWRGLSARHKFGTISMLFLLVITAFFSLLSWAPLAIIPITLILAVVTRYIIRIAKISKFLFFALVLLIFIMFLYAGMKAYPQLSELGKIAASSGYMAELSPKLVAFSFLIILITIAFLGREKLSLGGFNLGLLLVSAGTLFGISFLLLQGFSPIEPIDWYYYPRKFAWFTLFVLNFLTILFWVYRYSTIKKQSIWKKAFSYTLMFSIVVLFALEYPPKITSHIAAFPFIEVTKNEATNSKTIDEIASSIGTKQVRFDFNSNDFLVNQWTFQWKKFDVNKNVWPYAYSQILSIDDVCDVAEDWEGGVTLLTKSKGIKNQVLNICGSYITSVHE